MTDFQVLKSLVVDGVELTYGKMTLCDLSHYQQFRGRRKWQLFCDDKRIRYTDLKGKTKYGWYFVYQELDEALSKFLELKQKISNRVR
jgi:competence protein ComGF